MKTLVLLLVSIAAFSLSARSQENSPTPEHNSKPLYDAMPPALMQAELTDHAGVRFKLEDYRGRVVLINAWVVWARPCISDIANLVELYKEYKSSGLDIIGINIGDGTGNDETKETIERFRTRMKVNYRLAKAVNLAATTPALYAISNQPVVPQTILIDREGRIRGIFVGSGPSSRKARKEAVIKLLGEK